MSNQEKLDVLIARKWPVRVSRTNQGLTFVLVGKLEQLTPELYGVHVTSCYCMFYADNVKSINLSDNPNRESDINLE